MTYAKFTDDGVLDWTSEVPQEGLVAVELPLVGAGEEIRLIDGKVNIVRETPFVNDNEAEKIFEEALDQQYENAYFFAFKYLKMAFEDLKIKELPDQKIDSVSVLIPCYGKAMWVKDAVQSVLSQTKRADEIHVLLMDEASQAMKEELEALGENVVCEARERMDVCTARNYLAKECKSEYFCFLDADDILESDFIEKTTRAAADFIFTSFGNLSFGRKQELENQFPPFSGNLTGVFRKQAFFDLGGLDPAFAECGREDTDFILTVAESGKRVRLEKETRYYIRREEADSTWLSSSFIYSDAFQKARGKSAKMLIEKHRSLFLKYFHIEYDTKSVLFFRYIESGEKEHLFFNLMTEPAFRHKISNTFLSTSLIDKFHRKNYLEAALFTGDFTDWEFVNCDPSEEQKEAIVNYCKGRRFDVLFLCEPVNGNTETIGDILYGTDKALIHKTVSYTGKTGKAFRAYLYENYFCVHFSFFESEERKFIASWDDIKYLANLSDGKGISALSCFGVDEYISKYGRPYGDQMVSFSLNKECNRNCPYCTQAIGRPYPHYSDDEIYERFDTLLTYIEKLTDYNVAPTFVGGEPTLWSDYLIQKILKRLKDYSRIVVATNRDKKDSAWENDPRVLFYTHIVDWQNAGKLEKDLNELFMIVITHEDIPYLESFMRANQGMHININAYCGDDKKFLLTDEDRQKIAELEKRYPKVDDQIGRELAYATSYTTEEKRELCCSITSWAADCTYMTISPCCGWGQSFFPYKDFIGQRPDIQNCKNCNTYLRF